MIRPLALLCVAGGLTLTAACSDILEPPQDDPFETEHVFELARLGDPDAQTALGLLYERGLGVERDEDEAVYWYSSAAASGNALAEYHLGSLYERGLGVRQDYARAAQWYKSASAKGSESAQAALAYLYEQGLGVEQDKERAQELYAEVARAWAANYAAGAAAPARLRPNTKEGGTEESGGEPPSQMAESGESSASFEIDLSALDEADGPKETVFDWPDTVAGNGEKFDSEDEPDMAPATSQDSRDANAVAPAAGGDFAAGAAVGTVDSASAPPPAEPTPQDDQPEQNFAAGAAAPRSIQPSDVPSVAENAEEAFNLASVLGKLAPDAGTPAVERPASRAREASKVAGLVDAPSLSPLAVAAGSPPEIAEVAPTADRPVSGDGARVGDASVEVHGPTQPASLIERLATEPIDAGPQPRTHVAAAPGPEKEPEPQQLASLPPNESGAAVQPEAAATAAPAGETHEPAAEATAAPSGAPRAKAPQPKQVVAPPPAVITPPPHAMALASLDDPRVPNVPKPPSKPVGFWLKRHEPRFAPILRADETTKLEKWAREETLLKKFGVESGHAVRLATLATPDAAIRTWQRLQRRHPDLLGSLSPHMERVTYENAGAFIRLDAGPLANARAAEELCNALREEGQACRAVDR